MLLLWCLLANATDKSTGCAIKHLLALLESACSTLRRREGTSHDVKQSCSLI